MGEDCLESLESFVFVSMRFGAPWCWGRIGLKKSEVVRIRVAKFNYGLRSMMCHKKQDGFWKKEYSNL